MKTRYKVVKQNRISAMVNGNSKYALHYNDGEDVYAREDTLGVIVFGTLKDANAWVWVWNESNWYRDKKDLIILEVLPLGRGKNIISLSAEPFTEALDKFYRRKLYQGWLTQESPEGSMAFPGVYVVGEYARS